MDKGEEFVRIDAMFGHQPRQCHAVRVEKALLHGPGGLRVKPEQVLDINSHLGVDLGKQARARWIERVVEIEDPAVDMAKHPPLLAGYAAGRQWQ